MRTILIFLFLFSATIASSQEEKKVERLWLSVNHGFNRYNEIGGQVQIFDQFLVGAYLQDFRRKVGPGVAKNPYAFFYSPSIHKIDVVNSGSLMIGFASPTPKNVVLSFLVGPSLNRNKINTDIHVVQVENSKKEYLSSIETKSWSAGLNYKATLGIRIGYSVSLNFGLAGNYSSVARYNRFIIGVGVGNFGWNKSPKSSKNIERIIIIR